MATTIDVRSSDGNVFACLGIARRFLNTADMRDEADKLTADVFAAGSYREALDLIENATGGAVTFTGFDED